jgi:integration host factor alpha subunit
MSITKADIAERVARATGVTRRDALTSVETLLESIKKALEKGDKVSIVGFGTFKTKLKNSRKGRNPRTGDSIRIPDKRVAFFKPGKELRDVVNQ